MDPQCTDRREESLTESHFQPPQHLSRKLTAFSSIIFVYHIKKASVFLLEKLP